MKLEQKEILEAKTRQFSKDIYTCRNGILLIKEFEYPNMSFNVELC
jgi:hypothetical protein